MKTRLFIAVGLVIAALAGVGLWLSHRMPAARPMAAAPQLPAVQPLVGQLSMVPPVKLIVLNPVKMVPIAGRSKAGFLLVPGKNGWTDIQLIVDDTADYMTRLQAISRLPSKLTDADWSVLKGFLLKPDSLDDEQLGQVLKNEIMDKLCIVSPVPNGLETVLAQIYQDQEQNEVVRDYAVQHLATLDEMLAQSGGKGVKREEQTDQKVLWSAINEAGDSMAGTALLGLVRLSRQQNAGVDPNRLAATALGLANDTAAGELTQITAYQVCAQLNVQDALPVIESAAQNSPSVSLQISAIGALGLLGGTNDIPMLENLLQGNNERLQLPLQTALQRIESRTAHSASPQSS